MANKSPSRSFGSKADTFRGFSSTGHRAQVYGSCKFGLTQLGYNLTTFKKIEVYEFLQYEVTIFSRLQSGIRISRRQVSWRFGDLQNYKSIAKHMMEVNALNGRSMSDTQSNSDPEKGNSEPVEDDSYCREDESENSISKLSEPSTSKRSRASRTRSCVSTRTTTTSSKPAEWAEEEKMQLAIALQRYGHIDMMRIQKDVPTKTVQQIKEYVQLILLKSKYMNEKKRPKALIEQWLDAFKEVKASHTDEFHEMLAKTFLFISRYEPHPDPKDCDGVDYAAMYEFLYLALNGYPIKAVTPETAEALLKALEDLSQAMKKYGSEEEVEFLRNVKRIVYVENATKRHYGEKKTVSEEKGPIDSLLDVKGFNPLCMPMELFKDRPRQSNS